MTDLKASEQPSHRDALALVIGNSRLHWAWVQGHRHLRYTWDTPHLNAPLTDLTQVPLPPASSKAAVNTQAAVRAWLQRSRHSASRCSNPASAVPLWIASVVPSQTQWVATYPGARILTLEHLPLTGLYPTLGIDRALALLGAGTRWGFPTLVIDAGTALTVTGANADRHLVGGAILPGLSLQLKVLAQQTAALPRVARPTALPPRWAQHTETAIASGVIYGLLATVQTFITDWQRQFPSSSLGLTGGDASHLWRYLAADNPAIAQQVTLDPHLSFYGILALLA